MRSFLVEYNQWLWTALAIVVAALSIPANLAVSRTNPRELYLLWYVFSFFFVLFFALNFWAESNGQQIQEVLGQYAFIYDWMTSSKEETILVGAILYLGIVPQLITYVISGLFGAALLPRYLQQIIATAILSAVKFAIGLAAIQLSAECSRLVLGRPYSLLAVREACVSLAVSFMYASAQLAGMFHVAEVYYESFYRIARLVAPRLEPLGEPEDVALTIERMRTTIVRPWMRRIHVFFTRHVDPPAH